MNDKQWLDKLHHAYQVYSITHSGESVEHFITWLYQQYGILKPEIVVPNRMSTIKS